MQRKCVLGRLLNSARMDSYRKYKYREIFSVKKNVCVGVVSSIKNNAKALFPLKFKLWILHHRGKFWHFEVPTRPKNCLRKTITDGSVGCRKSLHTPSKILLM